MGERWWGAAVSSLALLAVAAPAAADLSEPGTIDDGTYSGRMVVAGSWVAQVEYDGAAGELAWAGDMSGPMSVTIANGTATGAWELTGPATLEGQFRGGGASGSMHGEQTTDAGGAVAGSGGDYALTGQASTTTTFDFGPGVPTNTSTVTDAVELPLTDLLFTCDDFVGRFDYRLKKQLTDAGIDEDLQGTFALVREPTTDETNEALDELGARMSAALAGLSTAADSNSRAIEVSWMASVRDAIAAAAAVAATLDRPSPCPAQQQDFLELAADLARQGLEALVTADAAGLDVPTDVLRAATLAAVATGVTGQPDGEVALAEVRDTVQRRWQDLGAEGAFDLDDPELLRIATFAAQMGWPLPTPDGGQIAAQDVLVMLGADG